MSSTNRKSIMAAIIEARPHHRVGHSALIKTGEHEEILNTMASDPFSLDSNPMAVSVKVMVEDWDCITSKGSNTRTGRTWRKTHRRHVKRIDQRAAAKDIQAQLADIQDERGEQDHADFLASTPMELLDELLDDLHSQDYYFDLDISTEAKPVTYEEIMAISESPRPAPRDYWGTHIETAVYIDMMATQNDLCPEQDLDLYRHASHLPENHVADAGTMISMPNNHLVDLDDMVTLDHSKPVTIADTAGLRLGSKLAKSGTVFGKVKHMTLQPRELDANDLPDMCENMIQAA